MELYGRAKQKLASLNPKERNTLVISGLVFFLCLVLAFRDEHSVCRLVVLPCLRFIFMTLFLIIFWIVFLLFQACCFILFFLQSTVVFTFDALAFVFYCLASLGAAFCSGLFKVLEFLLSSVLEGLFQGASFVWRSLANAGAAVIVGGMGLAGLVATVAASTMVLLPLLLQGGLIAAGVIVLANPTLRDQVFTKLRPEIDRVQELSKEKLAVVTVSCIVLVFFVLPVGAVRVVAALVLGAMIICHLVLWNQAFLKRVLATVPGLRAFERIIGQQSLVLALIILLCISLYLMYLYSSCKDMSERGSFSP
ncbi:uncharacterized protein [Littorina saxatilis]